MKTHYQLHLISPYGVPLDLLDMRRVQSLQYNRVVNDVGEIAFTVSANDSIMAYKDELDMFIEVYRDTGTGMVKDETYLLRYYDLFEDEGVERLILGGLSLNDLLARRVINPDDDPDSEAGFVTRAGAADVVMCDFVRYQMINPLYNQVRIVPNLYLTPLSGRVFNVTYQRRKREDKLLETLQDIANTTFCDFFIHRDSATNKLYFNAGQVGRNRSVQANLNANAVYFSQRRANLLKPRLRFDRKQEVTAIYVAGQGNEEDRAYVENFSQRVLDSPFNRSETVIDSRNEETLDELLETGQNELVAQAPRLAFDFELDVSAKGLRYNVDWFLGDIITVNFRDDERDYRIVEVIVKVDEGGETIKVKTERWPKG